MHYSFDALLISTVLAGVRRSTGLTLKSNAIENNDARSIVARYLEVGEWMLDTGTTVLGASGYFERRLP